MKLSKSWDDIILLTLIYLLSSTNFFVNYITDQTLVFWLSLSLRAAFLVFAFFFIKKNALPWPMFSKLKWKHLLLLPIFIPMFSNLFVAIFTQLPPNSDVKLLPMIGESSLTLLAAISEELVFRVLIFTELLKRQKQLLAIVSSSLIFGLVHLVNISSLPSILPTLSQVGYTFFLGLGCALAYFVTKNFVIPVIFHFGFNLFNSVISGNLYAIPLNLTCYIINVLFIVVCGLYGIWLYQFLYKKGITPYVT